MATGARFRWHPARVVWVVQEVCCVEGGEGGSQVGGSEEVGGEGRTGSMSISEGSIEQMK